MPLASFDQLQQDADARQSMTPIAVAGGADLTVLQALRTACDRGWVAPLVVGIEREVRRIADENGIGLNGFTLIDAEEPALAAVALVRNQHARLLMKGQVATPALMKAVLDASAGLRTDRVVCQVVLMELPSVERRFLLADTGVCIEPSLTQKIDILRNAVAQAHRLGVACPHVACVAATETIVTAMPETQDAAELERRNRAGDLPGCVVRGPLSFDLAFDADAAVKKKRTDPEFGVADILLFPNLLSANLTVKAIMYTSECRFGGVLCGAACPVVFMSRADSVETRLNSLALALYSNQP
jgi:phosphate butyryltransferase